jgi:hypothetical protein
MSSEVDPGAMSKEVSGISLFEKIAVFKRGTTLFELLETDFILAVSNQGKISWRRTVGMPGIINRVVPFEDVFEDVPASIQEGLAFHLDLFKE